MRFPVWFLRVLGVFSVLALLLAFASAPAAQARVEGRPRAVARSMEHPERALLRLVWRGAATGLSWAQGLVWPLGIVDVFHYPFSLTTLLLRTVVGGVIVFYIAFGVAVYQRWISTVDEEATNESYDDYDLD